MTAPLLEMKNVAKSFPGVRALDDVSLILNHGEVLTLAGENGAGKSTLLDILGGSLHPDEGTVTIEGVRRQEFTPIAALAEGVVIAHQEPAVVPQLTVEQNLLLGRSRDERLHATDQIAQALEDVRAMGFEFRPTDPVGRLSPAQRHAMTIAKAFTFGAKIVALDEPTTAMLEHNATAVLERVRELARSRGIGVIFVSHKMNEVMAVSDRVVVLRDGRIGYVSQIGDTSVQTIVRAMVGRELLHFTRHNRPTADAAVVLEASNIVHPTGTGPEQLEVRAGEVLGVAGLVGSGRTELLRAIVHADRGTSADIRIDGRSVRVRSPSDSRRAGIAFIPEDRKRQGLVLVMPAFANVALTAARSLVEGPGFIRPWTQARRVAEIAEEVGLRPRNVKLKARQFSGGNQQKLVIAKWLRCESRVYLFDEPTKGVDVGGRAEIYGLIDKLTGGGAAVVVVSSDLPEIIALSDRVLVMRNGHVVAEHIGDEIEEHALVASAMGVSHGSKGQE